MKVFIVAAMTLDGFMGTDGGHNSRDWRSKSDGKSFSRLLKWAGVMVMGSTTFKTFRMNRAPFGQRLLVYTHNPDSIALGENIETTSEDPRALVQKLAAEGYKGLAICGGTQINSLFWDAGVVDELYITVEPHIFGRGVPLFDTDIAARLELVSSTTNRDGSVRLHYEVIK